MSLALAALACWFALPAAAADDPQVLQVTQLKAQSSESERQDARKAFQNRHAIVIMTEGTVKDFGRLVGAHITDTKAFSKKGRSPISAGSALKDGVPLTLWGVAAYIDSNGVTRAVQTFAPENDPGDGKNGWKQRLNDWVAAEQTKAITVADDPGPPSAAWTLLYQTTIQSFGNAGTEQNTISIYRLNDINRTADYYMVYTAPQAMPNWYGNCNGFDQCDSHTLSRHFEHAAPIAGISLVEHGPTGTVGSGSTSFQLGGSVSASGPGVSAQFTATWSQPDVVTIDGSDGSNGIWDESFNMSGSGEKCNPIGGGVSPSSKGTFLSRQGTIFQVPEGTASLTFPITANAQFCSCCSDFIGVPSYETVALQANIPVGAPVLNATPQSLTIPAGGSAILSVNAVIPGSNEGFAWTLTTPSWVSVAKNSYTQPAVIPVAVTPGTPDGTTGFIKINSNPAFAAPSVENGEISIPITVGNAGPNITAGLLLFGGRNVIDLQNPEFYNLGSKQFSPINAPAGTRLGQTATVLNNGKVLIAGGGFATAELFDPSTLSFSPTGTMKNDRSNATATLLPDGKVLIAGGTNPNGVVAEAEVYDPASGAFIPAGSMLTPRQSHGATVIAQDKGGAYVLLYGGDNANRSTLGDSELWRESQLNFTPFTPMANAVRGFPNPVTDSAGVFHIVGGANDSSFAIANEQLLDLSHVTFSPGDSLQTPRSGHGLAMLENGDLLVTGGFDGSNILATAEVRSASGWKLVSGAGACPGAAGCMTTPRVNHTATTLPDGTVLLSGGHYNNNGVTIGTTEIFDPKTGTFTAGPAAQPREGHTASLVSTSATTLTNNPPTSSFGQSVELDATVTTGLGTAQGSVQFLDGTKVLATVALQDGSASYKTAALTQGSHTLTAVYSGGGGSAPSTSPAVTQQVGKTAAATVSMSGSPNPAQPGESVTFTASVAADQGTPSGTVTFIDGSTPLGVPQAIVNGIARFKTTSLSAGQHSITAIYNGDATFDKATAPVFTEYINSTATKLSATPNPSQQGQLVQLVATVTSANGSPTGSVNFLDGATQIGSTVLTNGTALFTTSSLAMGTHSLTAVYLGDSQFPNSGSAVVSLTVSGPGGGKVTPTVDLTVNGSNGATVSTGATATFIARVHAAAGYPAPNGSITISDSVSGTTYGSANIEQDPNSNDGLATIRNSAIPKGTYSLVATYGGDNEGKYYNGARSNLVSLTVEGGLGATAPQPGVTISAVAGQRSGQGTQLPITLTVKNTGTVPIRGVTLSQITLSTLAGSGQATLVWPSTPITSGTILPGQSIFVNLRLDAPLTVRQLRLNESGVLEDIARNGIQFSTGQVIVL